MAGTIIADDIQHSTAGSVGTEYVVQGSAKAWRHWNGRNTASTYDSFNMSTLTDRGTGIFTHAFTTAMSDTNYAFYGSCALVVDSNPNRTNNISESTSFYINYPRGTTNATTLNHYVAENMSGVTDSPRNTIVITGDLS